MNKFYFLQRIYVKVGKILFPAVVWDIDKRRPDFIDVLLIINGVALPRTFHVENVFNASDDKNFSFSTKKQIQNVTRVTQNHSDPLFEYF